MKRLWQRAGCAVILAALPLLLTLVATTPALARQYASMVMDARTGEVLQSQNADTRLHPASLTKMMTLYVAFQAIENGEIGLDTKVKITKAAAAEPASKLYLKAGSTIELRYLIRAAAVKSANDAAHAIADAIGGSVPGFAERMNLTAKALGMKNSTFRNPHGLTAAGHLSTARDMTVLGRHLFYDYPEYYNLFSRLTADAKVSTVANTNRRLLTSYPGADGIKTGYTDAAGSNLVSSAERGGVRIIATVFGGASSAARNQRIMELLDLGFRKAPQRVALRPPVKPGYIAFAAVAPAAETAAEAVAPKGARPERRPSYIVALAAAKANVLVAEAAVTRMAETGALIVEDGAVETAALAAPPPPRPDGLPPVEDMAGTSEEDEDGGEAGPTLAASDMPAIEDGETVELALAETVPTDAAPARRALSIEVTPDDAAAPAPVEPEVTMLGGIENALDAARAAFGASPVPRARVLAAAGADAVPVAAGEVLPEAVPTTVAAVAVAPEPEPEPARPVRSVTFSTSDMALAEVRPAAAGTVVSTRGGTDQWSVSVGRFATRWQAEKVLLRTALQQVDLLSGAKRQIVSKATGFEVQFVGLSQSKAELACQRLTARDERCTAFGS
mgnify:CR=1 FL=1